MLLLPAVHILHEMHVCLPPKCPDLKGCQVPPDVLIDVGRWGVIRGQDRPLFADLFPRLVMIIYVQHDRVAILMQAAYVVVH